MKNKWKVVSTVSQEITWEINLLGLPRFCIPAKIPLAIKPNLAELIPEIGYFGILIGVLPLRQY